MPPSVVAAITPARLAVDLRQIQCRLAQRFARRGECVLADAIQPRNLVAAEMIAGNEVGHLAGEACS
mgnify:CR=1 FL=1